MEKALPRREARENAFLLAFSTTFNSELSLEEALITNAEDSDHVVDEYGKRLLYAYYNHAAEINDLISERLRGWTMARIPRVSLTMMRIALAEMLFSGENKPSVAINEAVELVKRYGANDDYQFVNGLLGNVARELNLPDDKASEETV